MRRERQPREATHGGKRERIGRADAVEQRRHKPGDNNRSNNPEPDTQKREPSTLAKDEAKNVAAIRAERHADAEFLSALRDAVGDHAVNPDACKHERKRCEHAEYKHREARAGKRCRKKLDP